MSWQARLQYAAQLATSQDTLFMTWLDSGRGRSKTDESFQVTGLNNGHRLEVTRRGQTTQERLVISPSVNTWPPPLWQGAILARKLSTELWRYGTTSEARFTKYLTTILRLSYDNAEVTIDLRRTSNLSNILRRTQGLDTIYLRIHKIVWDSVRKLIYDIPKRNLGTL